MGLNNKLNSYLLGDECVCGSTLPRQSGLPKLGTLWIYSCSAPEGLASEYIRDAPKDRA